MLNIVGEYDDVVHPQSSLPWCELVGSRDTQTIVFPTGHIGIAVNSAAHKELWPRVGAWLKERGSKEDPPPLRTLGGKKMADPLRLRPK